MFSSSRYDHITPLLRQLHWLKARERIDFKHALLVYTCQHGAASLYITDELSQPADFKARRRLRSASSPSLIVRRTPLSTISYRAFPVAATRVWNSLPQYDTSATVFRSRLKTQWRSKALRGPGSTVTWGSFPFLPYPPLPRPFPSLPSLSLTSLPFSKWGCTCTLRLCLWQQF